MRIVGYVVKAWLVALALLVASALPVMAQGVQRDTSGDNVRETPRDVAGQPKAISQLTVNSPYCYQPDPRFDVCYVNFGSRAGQKIVLKNGFDVRSGGALEVDIDPALSTP